MEVVAKYNEIRNKEVKKKVRETAYKIFKELKPTEEEFKRAVMYYVYFLDVRATLDKYIKHIKIFKESQTNIVNYYTAHIHNIQKRLCSIIKDSRLNTKEIEILKLLLELEKFARRRKIIIASIEALLKSVPC